jgi:predicted transcriptional regulator with HTH domain
MNISLRKASVLQNSINDAIKSINLVTEVSLNEFQTVELELTKAVMKFKEDLARKDALVSAVYEIRKATSAANNQAGVDMRLADIAHLDKQIQSYTALMAKAVREDPTHIEGKLAKIRNRKEDSRSIYGFENTVSTSIFMEEDIKGFKILVSLVKKSKQKLQDELLELNVRTEIALSDRTVQTLTQEGLL